MKRIPCAAAALAVLLLLVSGGSSPASAANPLMCLTGSWVTFWRTSYYTITQADVNAGNGWFMVTKSVNHGNWCWYHEIDKGSSVLEFGNIGGLCAPLGGPVSFQAQAGDQIVLQVYAWPSSVWPIPFIDTALTQCLSVKPVEQAPDATD